MRDERENNLANIREQKDKETLERIRKSEKEIERQGQKKRQARR